VTKKKNEEKTLAEQGNAGLKEETAEKTQTSAHEEKLKELTDTLQHLQAEFENYKKRVDKENCEFVKIANEDLIRALLPIIDNFELALKSSKAKDDFYKGMELIYSQLVEALHTQGLRAIDCLGKKCDPYYHEVLLVEESKGTNEPDNTVVEELQKGYVLNDKVIRHSKVKIAKKKREQSKEEKISPSGD
jgi:molecular chaperone GrpE